MQQPIACMSCPKEPWRQPFPVDIHVWHAVPSLGSRQICAKYIWKAPGHSGQGPHWQSHNVHWHQVAEQGAGDWGPRQAKFKFPGCQKSTFPRSAVLLSLTWMNLKSRGQKSSLCQMESCRVNNTSPVVPCIHKSLDAVPCLLSPTNKYYFPV